MKKVISINFQGRVIPIEESAFEELKKYTESLQRYFAREEGKDEINNDPLGSLGGTSLTWGPAPAVDLDFPGVACSLISPSKSSGRPMLATILCISASVIQPTGLFFNLSVNSSAILFSISLMISSLPSSLAK